MCFMVAGSERTADDVGNGGGDGGVRGWVVVVVVLGVRNLKEGGSSGGYCDGSRLEMVVGMMEVENL